MSEIATCWVPFDEAVSDATSSGVNIPKSNYLPMGSVPIIDQGAEFIGGYTNEKNRCYSGKLPILVFGDHTRIFKFIDFNFASGADGVKILSPKTGFYPRYLYYYFLHLKLPSAGYSRHFKFLRDVMVPRPPLDEQRRIVDILDRAASICRLRQQAQNTARLIIPALFNKMFGDPATNPQALPVQPLGDLVKFVSGATPSKAVPAYWEGELPWISAKDLKAEPIFGAQDHISDEGRASARLHVIPSGTNLVLVRGMTLIHTVPIRITGVPVTINQDVKALMPRQPLDGVWLRWALQCLHHVILAQVSSAAHGTRKLDLDRLQAIQVPVPPLKQQKVFSGLANQVICMGNKQAASERATLAASAALQSRVFS